MPSLFKKNQFVTSKDVIMIPDAPVNNGPRIDFASIFAEGDVGALERAYDNLVKMASEDAKIYSEQVLGDARRQKEDMINQARMESIKIKQQAEMEGFQEASKERNSEISQCIDNMRDGLADLYLKQEMFFDEYAANLAKLSVQVANKVIAGKMQEDDLLLTEMVHKAVNAMKDSDWISVEISDALPRLAETLTKDLRSKTKDYGTSRIDVTTSDSPIGTCIVQNADGVIDASVGTQLENLITYFCEIE